MVLYAWVLMANHFHLVVKTPRANLSRFMQRLNSSYSLYFRYKHMKPGHVLGGRYKAPLIEDESYLLGVTRYVHLNPVKTQAQKQLPGDVRIQYLESYEWSSYPSYVGAKSWPDWINNGVLMEYGRSLKEARRRYRAYVHAGVVLEEDGEILDIMKSSPYVIGSAAFVEQTEVALSQRATGGPSDADVALPWKGARLEVIDQVVSGKYGVLPDDLREHGRAVGIAKMVAVELAARRSGETLRAIGQHYGGISSQAVAMTRQRSRKVKGIDWAGLEHTLEHIGKM